MEHVSENKWVLGRLGNVGGKHSRIGGPALGRNWGKR